MVAGQKIALGRAHAIVTVQVAEHTITVEYGDGGRRTVRRTITQPVRSWKAHHPARPQLTDRRLKGDRRGHHRSGGAGYGPAPPAQGSLRDRCRDRLRRPFTLEPLPALRQDPPQAQDGRRTSAPPELTPDVTNDRDLRFLAPTSSITWNSNVKHQLTPDQ